MIDEMLTRLRAANDEIALQLRRIHPEALTPRQWIVQREAFIERLNHVTDAMEHIMGAAAETRRMIEEYLCQIQLSETL